MQRSSKICFSRIRVVLDRLWASGRCESSLNVSCVLDLSNIFRHIVKNRKLRLYQKKVDKFFCWPVLSDGGDVASLLEVAWNVRSSSEISQVKFNLIFETDENPNAMGDMMKKFLQDKEREWLDGFVSRAVTGPKRQYSWSTHSLCRSTIFERPSPSTPSAIV